MLELKEYQLYKQLIDNWNIKNVIKLPEPAKKHDYVTILPHLE